MYYGYRTEETYVGWIRRLLECLRLRVKDVDFARREILVREGKGNKDRVTMLAAVEGPLLKNLDRVRRLHERDLHAGLGRVQMPDALAHKYPNANREWDRQWVFPAPKISTDPRFGPPQRYHLHETVPGHEVRTVTEMGWAGTKNGPLLRQAAAEFDVFLTVDQGIEFQQSLTGVDLAVIVMAARTNDIDDLRPLMPRVLAALVSATSGEVVVVRQGDGADRLGHRCSSRSSVGRRLIANALGEERG